MKHRIKKIKFKKGQDANQALMRKLITNFLKHGKLETTLSRAKALKSSMDSLTYKSMNKTEARNSVLLSKFGDPASVERMFTEIGPSFKNRTGGFVRIIKLGKRQGDNADMARLEWTKNINKKQNVEAKASKKAAPAKKNEKEAAKKVTKKADK